MATDKDKVRLRHNIIKANQIKLCVTLLVSHLSCFECSVWNEATTCCSFIPLKCETFSTLLNDFDVFLFVPSLCKSFYGHEREVKKRRVYNVQICSIEWRSDIMDRFYLNTLCFAATSITASKDFVMINDTLKCKYAHRHETGPTKCGWLVRFKFYFCQTENLKKL